MIASKFQRCRPTSLVFTFTSQSTAAPPDAVNNGMSTDSAQSQPAHRFTPSPLSPLMTTGSLPTKQVKHHSWLNTSTSSIERTVLVARTVFKARTYDAHSTNGSLPIHYFRCMRISLPSWQASSFERAFEVHS
jgi:hypothetical protein